MRFVIALALLLAPGLASAQVYKCKDSKTGRVTFTVDEQGERQYPSTEQNDAMREAARQSVATECS